VEGELIHRDSHGYEARVTPQNLMVMNAGAEIWHEERMDEAGPETHMLQIFVRPHTPELDSHVSFGDPGDLIPGVWRPIAGPHGPLAMRNRVWVFDRQAQAEEELTLPAPPEDGLAAWVYVFSGELQGEGFSLSAGDGFALLPGDEPPQVQAKAESRVVLFWVDLAAPAVKTGTLSG
jgi:redox-sensitive bicupin YhaK (pirin superfamily)